MPSKEYNNHFSEEELDRIDARVDSFSSQIEKNLPSDSSMTLIVLKGHLLAEHQINHLLKLCSENEDINVEDKTFSEKVDLLDTESSLDQKELKALTNLNKLRNNLAHELNYQVSESDIDSIGFPLGRGYVIKKFDIFDEHNGSREEALKPLLCSTLVKVVLNPQIKIARILIEELNTND
jgi:uncharacterized protein YutE (UPF0331/DUF86 family)